MLITAFTGVLGNFHVVPSRNLVSGNGVARSGFVYFRMVERCPSIQCGGGKYAVSGGSHCRIVCSKLYVVESVGQHGMLTLDRSYLA